jgi:hypothetical protein
MIYFLVTRGRKLVGVVAALSQMPPRRHFSQVKCKPSTAHNARGTKAFTKLCQVSRSDSWL